MVVTERINLVFVGQFQGIHRTIPIEYPGLGGTNYTLFLDVRGVTDESGHVLKYESTIKGEYRNLRFHSPGAVDTNKVVQISYLVRNGIRFFPDHDELYWNVTGNDWPVPIDNATAFVRSPRRHRAHFARRLLPELRLDQEKEATARVQGNNVAFGPPIRFLCRRADNRHLLPKGILPEPSALTRAYWWFRSNPIILLRHSSLSS